MRPKTILWALALALGTWSALLPATAAADFQGFLRIPGVQGDSQDDQHQGDIDLISYTQTVGNKACFKAVVIKGLDRASVGLALLAVNETRVAKATVTLRKSGNIQFDPLVVVMEDVLIGSVELVELDGGPTPTERVVLLPRKATLTSTGQEPSGQPVPTGKAVINCP
jgi:type VI protein secretion system component Hcp